MPINLVPLSQFNGMITKVKKAAFKLTLNNFSVIKSLHLYYDMKLVTFDIYDNLDLIAKFPVLVQPYTISNRNFPSPYNR